MLAADAQVARSILLYKDTQDKIAHLSNNKALACAGPQSDCVSFTEYVSKNMALYELNNDVKLTTKAAATFIRGEVRWMARCVVDDDPKDFRSDGLFLFLSFSPCK